MKDWLLLERVLCCSIFCSRSIFSCHRMVFGLRLPLRFGFLRCLPRFRDFRDFPVPPQVPVSGLDFPARIGTACFPFSPAPDFRSCSTGPRAPGASFTVLSCRRFSCRPLLGFGHTAHWLSVSFSQCSLRSPGKARPCAEFLLFLSFHRFSLPSSQFRPAVFFASSCARFNLHRWSSVFGCFLRAERAALAGFGFASSLRTVQLLGARFPRLVSFFYYCR
jgi:hypothetical protein